MHRSLGIQRCQDIVEGHEGDQEAVDAPVERLRIRADGSQTLRREDAGGFDCAIRTAVSAVVVGQREQVQPPLGQELGIGGRGAQVVIGVHTFSRSGFAQWAFQVGQHQVGCLKVGAR